MLDQSGPALLAIDECRVGEKHLYELNDVGVGHQQAVIQHLSHHAPADA